MRLGAMIYNNSEMIGYECARFLERPGLRPELTVVGGRCVVGLLAYRSGIMSRTFYRAFQKGGARVTRLLLDTLQPEQVQSLMREVAVCCLDLVDGKTVFFTNAISIHTEEARTVHTSREELGVALQAVRQLRAGEVPCSFEGTLLCGLCGANSGTMRVENMLLPLGACGIKRTICFLPRKQDADVPQFCPDGLLCYPVLPEKADRKHVADQLDALYDRLLQDIYIPAR